MQRVALYLLASECRKAPAAERVRPPDWPGKGVAALLGHALSADPAAISYVGSRCMDGLQHGRNACYWGKKRPRCLVRSASVLASLFVSPPTGRAAARAG